LGGRVEVRGGCSLDGKSVYDIQLHTAYIRDGERGREGTEEGEGRKGIRRTPAVSATPRPSVNKFRRLFPVAADNILSATTLGTFQHNLETFVIPVIYFVYRDGPCSSFANLGRYKKYPD